MDLNIDYAQLSALSENYRYVNDLPKDDTIKNNEIKQIIFNDKDDNIDFK